MCLADMLGQPGGGTYAGVVADALAYYGLECEFAFVKHGDDRDEMSSHGSCVCEVATGGHVGGLCYRMM
jgi:hypothetical protein